MASSRTNKNAETSMAEIRVEAWVDRVASAMSIMVEDKADSKFVRVCASPRKYILWVQWNTDL